MYEQLYWNYSTVIGRNSQYIPPCPPREKSTWHMIWSSLNKKNVNKCEVDQIKEEHEIPDEIPEPPGEKNVVADIEALCDTIYCHIKMQDPCEICCCTICRVEEDLPCEGVPRGQRRSICECHPEEKLKKEHECCDACEYHGLRRV